MNNPEPYLSVSNSMAASPVPGSPTLYHYSPLGEVSNEIDASTLTSPMVNVWSIRTIGRLVDDEEGDATDGSRYDFAHMSQRALTGATLRSISTGRAVASYPSGPVAIARDCRAITTAGRNVSLYTATGHRLWTRHMPGSLGKKADILIHFVGAHQQYILVYLLNRHVVTLSASTGRTVWSRSFAHYNSVASDAGLNVWDGRGDDRTINYATGRAATYPVHGLLFQAGPALIGCTLSEAPFGKCHSYSTTTHHQLATLPSGLIDASGIGSRGYLVVTRTTLNYYTSTGHHAVWTRHYTGNWLGEITSPTATATTLYVPLERGHGAPNHIDAISLTTGSLRWRTDLPAGDGSWPGLWVSPTTNTVYAYPSSYVAGAGTYALNSGTGHIRWHTKLTLVADPGSPVLIAPGRRILAVNAATGRSRWSATH